VTATHAAAPMEPELDTSRNDRAFGRTTITVVLSAVAVGGVFLIDVLVVPIVVLIAFYVVFAAVDRAQRDGGSGRLSA